MTFLNPLFLIGLVAAAIPLIIHLFNFRKPKRVDFSSLAFLREVQRSTMQRVRIKQWLLLLLRTLAIAALVISFARPLLRGTLATALGGTGSSSIAIVLDPSPSMEMRDAGGAYLDQARRAAEAIASSTDSRDDVRVIALDGALQGTAAPGGEVAASRVRDVSPSRVIRSLSEGLEAAMDRLSAATHPAREIYLVSDLQSSTLTDSAYAPAPSGIPIFVVPIGTGLSDNVAVTDVRVASRIVEADQPVRIEATLVNHGDTPAAAYSASLFLDGARVAQITTDLPPHVPTTVQFVTTPAARGWLEGYVALEDDAFPADNVQYFTLHTPERRTILLVRGDGADTRFLSALLSERLSGNVARFNLTQIDENALPSNDLGAFDVVLLAGPASLSSGETGRLEQYVDAGGGLLWFPGERMVAEDYNRLLGALGGGSVGGLTPPAAGLAIDVVDRIDQAHPLFEGILAESGGGLERPQVFRRLIYEPGGGTERSLMQLGGGGAFLQEIRHGRGTVLLFGVAPSLEWSDLPTRGLIVPLLLRSVFLLSATESVSGERFLAGSEEDVLLPGVSETLRIVLRGPDGSEFVPERRRVIGGLLLDVKGRLTEPGVYDLVADGRVLRRIASNMDPRESDLRRAESAEAISRLSAGGALDVTLLPVDGTDLDAAREALVSARQGIELWNVFLLLALLCLVAETIIAKRWRPESAGS